MEDYYGFKRAEAIVKYFNEVGGMETNRLIAVEKTNLNNIKPVYLDNESFTLDSGQYYVDIQIAVLPK